MKVLLTACGLTLLLTSSFAYSDDPYAALWQTQADAVKTLEVNFTHRKVPGVEREMWSVFDLETGWARGTAVYSIPKPTGVEKRVDAYGLSGSLSWCSVLMPDGHNRIDITAADRPLLPEVMLKAAIGYEELMPMFLPPHILLLQQLPEDKRSMVKVDLQSDSPSEVVLGGRRLVYFVTVDSSPRGKIIYEADLSDGVRIYRIEEWFLWKEKETLSAIIENADFQKTAGVWIAMKTKYEHYKSSAEVESVTDAVPSRTRTVTIHNITVNKDYQEEFFRPKLLPGDFVVDSVANVRYVVPSADTEAEEIAPPSDLTALPAEGTTRTTETPVPEIDAQRQGLQETVSPEGTSAVSRTAVAEGPEASRKERFYADKYVIACLIVVGLAIGLLIFYLIRRATRPQP